MQLTEYQCGMMTQAAHDISRILAELSPDDAHKVFHGFLGNVIGNLPDEVWEGIKREAAVPCACGKPNCDKIAKDLMAALDAQRVDFKAITQPMWNN